MNKEDILEKKVDDASVIIGRVIDAYSKPVVFSGFGKDSMVLLNIMISMGIKPDCVFFRDPYFPIKYRFANAMIEKWNLRTYHYPHCSIGLFNRNNTFEVVRYLEVGVRQHLAFCARLYEPDDFSEEEYLCALDDLVHMPMGRFNFPWDVALSGARRSETKAHTGGKPSGLKYVLKQVVSGCDWAYPLRDFTAEDICLYHMVYDVPIHEERYEIKGGKIVDRADPTHNPDARPACFRCIDKCQGDQVWCPKKNLPVNNISRTLPEAKMPDGDYEQVEV